MAGKRTKGSKGAADDIPPVVSTLPPPVAAKPARKRRLPDDLPKGDLPKGDLPKPKRKPKAATVKDDLTVAPVWDVKKEAEAAKLAAIAKAKKAAGPIVPPPGAIHIPGVTTLKEPMPHGGALKRSKKEPEEPVRTTPPKKSGTVEVKPKRVFGPVTDEVFDQICADLADGLTLRQICRRPDRPSATAVYKFRDGDDLDADDPASPDIRSSRRVRFARARELGEEALAQECLDIADDATNDWITRTREDGREEEVLDRDHIQRSKLRIETRLKLLAVWNPAKYGNMIKLGDPNAKPLDSGGKSASDIAIGFAKLIVAAKREAGIAEDVGGDEA